ncbi:MAG: hypothetical protein ACYCQI_05365 [Gammaproteobacteria bacterium]
MESNRDEKESLDLKQDFAELFAIIQALPTLDDGAWKDLFDMCKSFYSGYTSEDVKIRPHDPIARVFHFLNVTFNLLDSAEESLESPLEYLPTNQQELLMIKRKVALLRDIIHQSYYGNLAKESDGLDRLYALICQKLAAGVDDVHESKYAEAPKKPLFIIDPKDVEEVRLKFTKHTLSKSVLNLYAVTNVLDSGNIFAAIRALADFGDRLQHKYGENSNYVEAMKIRDFPTQIPTPTALILLSSIRQAYANLKSEPGKEEHAQMRHDLLLGLDAWTSMLAPKIQLPEPAPESVAHAQLMIASPKVQPDKVIRSLRRLAKHCAEYQRYLEDEIKIRLASIYASSRQMEDVYDLVGATGAGEKTEAQVVLAHWDRPVKGSYLERHLKSDANFGIIVEKYRRISDLNATLEEEQKPLEKAAVFAEKFFRYKPIFEERPDEGWKKVVKVISAAVAILTSIPLLGLPYFIHQTLWRTKDEKFTEKTTEVLKTKSPLSDEAKKFIQRPR